MKKLMCLFLLLLSLQIVLSAEELITLNMYAPDNAEVETDPVYIFTQKIELLNATSAQATFLIAGREVTLQQGQEKQVGDLTYTISAIAVRETIAIQNEDYTATKVTIDVGNDGTFLPENEYIIKRNEAVNILGNSFELDEIFSDDTARIKYGKEFGSVKINDHRVFYGLPLAVRDITLSRGTESETETKSMYVSVDKNNVDLSYFPSMYIYTKVPIRVVIPNEATPAQHELADNILTYLENKNRYIEIEKTSDTYLQSHNNYNLILIGDTCQNTLTKFYAPLESPCDRQPSIQLFKNENRYITVLMAQTEEGYLELQGRMFTTTFQGLLYTFTDVTTVPSEPITFDLTPIEEVPTIEEPIFLQPEEPVVVPQVFKEPQEEIIIEEPQEEIIIQETPKGESTYSKNWKKAWNLLMWFFT